MKFAFWTYNAELQYLNNNKLDSYLQNKVCSANYYAKISTVIICLIFIEVNLITWWWNCLVCHWWPRPCERRYSWLDDERQLGVNTHIGSWWMHGEPYQVMVAFTKAWYGLGVALYNTFGWMTNRVRDTLACVICTVTECLYQVGRLKRIRSNTAQTCDN